MRSHSPPRIAVIYDRITKYGGAERILTAIHELYPKAPFYAAVHDPGGASWAAGIDIRTTFLNRLPFARRNHELFAWLTPFAFETLNLDGYDCVVSVTSAEAKGVMTKPGTAHLCYCLTPTRYLWSGAAEYLRRPGLGVSSVLARLALSGLGPYLRRTDSILASRPDEYVAISNRVAGRIRLYYGREASDVIYPPVDTDTFTIRAPQTGFPDIPPSVRDGGFYLLVSRLVGYKRVDLAVEAFTEMKLPLVVIGDGRDRNRLKKLAGPSVHFVHRKLTDGELVDYHNRCTAFVYAGDEDFGLVAAEANACGRPVIAYRESGIAEIVIHGKTGFLFPEQSRESLIRAVRSSAGTAYGRNACRMNALRFGRDKFKKRFSERIDMFLKKEGTHV